MDQKPYSIRLMMQDAFSVFAPSLLLFLGLLWIDGDEAWLAQVLATILPF